MNNQKILSFTLLAILCLSPLSLFTVFPGNSTSQSNSVSINATQPQQAVPEVKPGGTLTEYTFQLTTLNPLHQISVSDGVILERIFDDLVTMDPYRPSDYVHLSGQMLKSLSTKVIDATGDNTITRRNGSTVSDNTTRVWTMELRHDYYWHDGAAITAEDLVFTYQLYKWISYRPASSATVADYMPDMQYYRAEAPNGMDGYKVKLYMGATGLATKRRPLFIDPVPQHIYSKASTWEDGATGTFNMDNAWAQGEEGWDITGQNIINYRPYGADDPILTGSGPFIIESTDSDIVENMRRFILVRNPNYWWSPYNENGKIRDDRSWNEYLANPEEYDEEIWPDTVAADGATTGYRWGPYIDQLNIRVIEKESFEWEAFKNDEIDFAAGVAVTTHLKEIRAKGYNVHSGIEWGYENCHLNVNATKFLRDWKFRRALDWAINKKKIVEDVLNGRGIPLMKPISTPPYDSVWNYEAPMNRYGAYPAKARDLVTNISWIQEDTNGDGFVEYAKNDSKIKPFEVICGAEPLDKREGLIVKNSLEDAGIPVELKSMTWSQWIDKEHADDYQMGLSGWSVSSFPDWFDLWDEWVWDTYYNWGGPGRNESFPHAWDYHKAYKKFRKAKTVEDAAPYVQTMDKLMYKYVAEIFSYREKPTYVFDNKEWTGLVEGAESYNYWTYHFAAKRAGYEEEAIEGFSRGQNAKVSGKVTFQDTVSGSVDVSGNISYLTLSVDHGEEKVVSDRDILSVKVNSTGKGEAITQYEFEWSYTLDTTKYDNGKHLITLRVYGLKPTPVKYELLITVDNPVPVTKRTSVMAAISAVIAAVVVGGAVFMVMRKKKPPAE